MTHLVCVACRRPLTTGLIPGGAYNNTADFREAAVSRGRLARLEEEDAVPVTRADGTLIEWHVYSPAGALAIHTEDALPKALHSTGSDNGCCGSDGCDGPNRACVCGAVVATEWADCWTQAEIRFLPDAVATVDGQ